MNLPLHICLDPGHQANPDNELEPIAPYSTRCKPRCAAGTAGLKSLRHEYEVVLGYALLIEKYLVGMGADATLTRRSHDVTISNVERAAIANRCGAQLCIKIHCNGVRPSLRFLAWWKRGLMTLTPDGPCISSFVERASCEAARLLHPLVVEATGFPDLGVRSRSDLTGFNWSEIPVLLLELGYLTNPAEERLLLDEDFRCKVCRAISQGVAAIHERGILHKAD